MERPVREHDDKKVTKPPIIGRANQAEWDELRAEPLAAFTEGLGVDRPVTIKRHPKWKAIALLLDVQEDVAKTICITCGESPN